MSFFCRIYVDEKQVYSGDFAEVPEKFRGNIRENLSDWAGSLGRRELNELIYSLFIWYDKKVMYCKGCGAWKENEKGDCTACGSGLEERFVYERNAKLDMLLTCVGMISRVEISM